MTTSHMTPTHDTSRDPAIRGVVVTGLAVGAALGFGGNFAPQGAVQDLLYVVSAVGLITASVVLAMQHLVRGRQLAAAGFALLALGETRLANATDAPGGESGFAVGVLLYAVALPLIASAAWAPGWARILGAAAAAPFAVHGLIFFSGGSVDTAGPLASVGYTLLTVTIVGWIITILRAPER